VKEYLKNQIIENVNYAHEYGVDKPELAEWKWPYDRKGTPIPDGVAAS